MIYPAQTSLIPVQVALARFLETHGWQAIFTNYPFWYLGSTPFRYLTGPILPTVLVGLHRLQPELNFFEIIWGLLVIAWLFGGLGIYFLIGQFRGDRLSAILTAVFYLFGPLIPFLFRFSDSLYLVTFSFLPCILALYSRFLQAQGPQKPRKDRKNEILLCLLIAFVILLDSLIIPTLIFGMAAIFLAQVGWKRAEEKLKQTFFIFLFSILISTIWYTPGYWLTLLGAPSLAGKGLAVVAIWLGKLVPAALAFGGAIVSVKFFKKRNLLRDFCFYWLFIFGCLTLIRFLSDPDFWLDWTAYGMELQFGFAIALGVSVSKLFLRTKLFAFCFLLFAIIIASYILLFTYTINIYALGTLQKDISQTVEYRIGRQLSEVVMPGERVFLSGTTAFWLNAFFDIPQIRGGVDQASVNHQWREAVWEIRNGSTGSPRAGEKSVDWLKKLGISYLVVHTKESEEVYHDFVFPEKFEGVESLEKIYEERGDRIYRVLD